jgi:hypothetical protein
MEREFHRYQCALAAAIDPLARPAARVLQGLFFVVEVIKRIELVARFRRRIAGAFEQQVGGKRTVGQTMCRRLDGIAVVMMNVFALHFNFKYSYACRANQDEPVRAEANAYRERR